MHQSGRRRVGIVKQLGERRTGAQQAGQRSRETRNHEKQERSDKGQSAERSREGKDKGAEESIRIEQRIEIEGTADLQLKPVDRKGTGFFEMTMS